MIGVLPELLLQELVGRTEWAELGIAVREGEGDSIIRELVGLSQRRFPASP